jgi:hypothetical protein
MKRIGKWMAMGRADAPNDADASDGVANGGRGEIRTDADGSPCTMKLAPTMRVRRVGKGMCEAAQ